VTRILSTLPLFLLPLAALAVEAEPPVESNLIGTVVFLLLFVGGCAVFAWMVWKGDKKPKQKARER
jgi:hypothetical protein